MKIAMSSSIALRRSPTRSLYRRDLEAAAQLVHHERCERLALDVLGDDDKRLRGLDNCFEQRQKLCRPDSFFS